jgi:tetratricopeptide (TPR) repeat protein
MPSRASRRCSRSTLPTRTCGPTWRSACGAPEFRRAVEELKKAIAANPRHHQSRYNLGVILVQDKKDLEGGIRAWEGLLENVPDYPYRDQLKAEIERLAPPRQ